MKRILTLALGSLWLVPLAQAHVVSDTTQKAPANWFNLDPQENQVPGVSTEKAYEYLRNRPSRTVVVAVIDSGIDIKHEDLQDKIWINPGEVPGNGLDDDKNGYVDDVHGWNFIGGKDGRNVEYDTQEMTRLYVQLKEKFEGQKTEKLKKKEKAQYALYRKVKAAYEEELKSIQSQYTQFQRMYQAFQGASSVIAAHLGRQEFTDQDVMRITSADPEVTRAKALLLYLAQNELNREAFKEGDEYFTAKLKYHLNPDYNPREIVGDDYQNVNERGYGNNDVTGAFADHGTHVAGIIGASRSNNLGIKGIADNVRIMVLRAVPNGDERDKDIANAIYYAVDNGAKVINMSFGKDYSPQKAAVDAAVKYAASKGVLLVHGAGNDARNNDENENYPSPQVGAKQPVKNWLEVGASSWGDAANFVGTFSNYGKNTVDVFAPGVDVYSTVPNQGYKSNSGTSMAAPVTSGIGALLFSYFPDLTAEQVREIIVKSTVKYPTLKVNKPAEGRKKEMIEFGKLSVSGGIVNAYEAVRMAEALSGK